VAYLDKHADPKPPGKQKCATYVKKAIEKGGVNMDCHPKYAKDYDACLTKRKFNKLPSSTHGKYTPRKGDIVVFQAPPGQDPPMGHIQMYNGEEWVSDFKQGKAKRNFRPGPSYRGHKPPISYEIYRP
jgi:hypothetical protein